MPAPSRAALRALARCDRASVTFWWARTLHGTAPQLPGPQLRGCPSALPVPSLAPARCWSPHVPTRHPSPSSTPSTPQSFEFRSSSSSSRSSAGRAPSSHHAIATAATGSRGKASRRGTPSPSSPQPRDPKPTDRTGRAGGRSSDRSGGPRRGGSSSNTGRGEGLGSRDPQSEGYGAEPHGSGARRGTAGQMAEAQRPPAPSPTQQPPVRRESLQRENRPPVPHNQQEHDVLEKRREPLLRVLLRAVEPLESAGYAYCAVRCTAAWLHGVLLPQHSRQSPPPQQAPGPPQGQPEDGLIRDSGSGAGDGEGDVQQRNPDLEIEVQWDQMQTVHELFAREGSGWLPTPVRQLPGGRAHFSMMTSASPPKPSTTATTAPAVEAGLAASSRGSAVLRPPVTVSVTCTYNTVLRANPARVLITPPPPPPPPSSSAVVASDGSESRGAEERRGRGGVESFSGGGGGGDSVVEAAGNPAVAPQGLLTVLTSARDPSATGTMAGGAGGTTRQVWAQSLYSVAVEAERIGDQVLADAVAAALRAMQRELSARNTAAWGRSTAYDAWVARFGTPREAAARLLRDPGRCLGPLLPYLQLHVSPPLAGLRVANLLGSHGHKAVALAALGASVTVLDASSGNAAYARELAAAAGLAHAVSYVVGDLAELPPRLREAQPQAPQPPPMEAAPGEGPTGGNPHLHHATTPGSAPALAPGQYDLVLMEMGVLHYFLDLRELMADIVAPLLRPGGRFLLREFHPVSTKLVSSRGRKHKVTGDYFASQPLTAVDVAYSKYEEAALGQEAFAATDSEPQAAAASAGPSGSGSRPRVLLRRWGLGEVVSAVAGSGRLRVVLLDEEPGARLDDAGLPKLFTLLSERV